MKNKNFLVILVIFLVLISLNFVFSIHTSSPPSFSVNVSQSYIFNITLNNTNIGEYGNITQINITLPSAISFVSSSNGTSSLANFSNTSTILTWKNSSYFPYIINSSINNINFWFNATISLNPGNYNITVTSQNATEAYSTNISIAINDLTNPFVTILYPTNRANYSFSNITFNISATDNVNISSCWYTLDSGINNKTMIANSSNTGFNATNSSIANGLYTAKFSCNDTSNNLNNTQEVSFTIDTVAPIVTIISPLNITYTTSIGFNFSLNEAGTCIYSLGSGATNSTMTANSSSTGFSATNTSIADGGYTVYAYCNDTVGNKNYTTTQTFTMDNVAPVIALILPTNASSSTSTSPSWLFYFNVTDADPSTNCSLVLDSTMVNSNSSLNITGGSNLFARNISAVGIHIWSINCTDLGGNNNQTETRTFTITQASGDSDNSGGSAGTAIFWTLTQTLTLQQFNDGFARELGARNRIKFTINGAEHYAGVISLTNTTATINISSNPQQAVFGIGDEKRFEVTGDDYYDILATLNNISNNKANITIKSIHEKTNYTSTTTPSANTNQTNNETTTTTLTSASKQIIATGKSLFKSTWFWILIVLIIIIAIIVIFSLFLKKRYYNKGYRKKWD